MSNHELASLKSEIDGLIEERMSSLMSQVKLIRALVGRMEDTSSELKRQHSLKNSLEARLGGRNDKAIKAKLAKVESNLRKLDRTENEILSSMNELKSELANG